MTIEVEFLTKKSITKEDKYSLPIRLYGQQTYPYLLSSKTAPIFMRLQLPGFQKTDEILVYSENMTKTTQKITIFSEVKAEKVESVNIYMYYQSDNLKVQSIFVYSKGCIINATKENLLFYSVKSLGNTLEMLNKMKWSKALLPGQGMEQNPSYQIILFDDTTEIAIAHKAAPNQLSNSVSIKGVGQTQVAAITVLENLNNRDNNNLNKVVEQLYEFAVNISSKCSGFFFHYYQ